MAPCNIKNPSGYYTGPAKLGENTHDSPSCIAATRRSQPELRKFLIVEIGDSSYEHDKRERSGAKTHEPTNLTSVKNFPQVARPYMYKDSGPWGQKN